MRVEDEMSIPFPPPMRRSTLRSNLSEPTLDALLIGRTAHPVTKAEFRAALRVEASEENLDFVEAIQKLRLKFSESDAAMVVEQFLKPGSDLEVNISAKARQQVLDADPLTIEVFQQAEQEVKELLSTDSFPRFLDSLSRTNLAERNAKWRMCVGLIFLFLGVAMSLAMIVMTIFEVVPVLAPRWWRILAFPMWLQGFTLYIQGKRRICPVLAARSVQMLRQEGFSWLNLVTQKTPAFIVKEDFVRLRLQQKAIRAVLTGVLLAFLATALIVILPPGNDLYPNL